MVVAALLTADTVDMSAVATLVTVDVVDLHSQCWWLYSVADTVNNIVDIDFLIDVIFRLPK